MAVLSVDAGTTVIKAVLFGDDGAELTVARAATQVLRPGAGRAEQDMDAVWEAVVRTCREAADGAAEPVRLVAFTAQGDGAWLVDGDGRPTGPAVLWSDGRAGGILSRWEREGVLAEAFRRSGSLTCSGMPNALFSWFSAHDPGRLERSAVSLTAAGWLFLRFTGRVGADLSDASAPFLDHATGDWDPGLLRLFGVEEHARLLPPVLGENDRVGGLTAGAARVLGLPEGLPVVMAPYDIAATARGVGAVEPGQACGILGTTLCTEILRTSPDTSGEPSGISIASGDGLVLRAFPTLNGTDVLAWTARTLGVDGPPALAELAFSGGDPAPGGGPLFLPYLSPAGERAPFLDPGARGVFLGLSLDHAPRDLARAVFDGLSLVLRDALTASGAEVSRLRLCGGGANSDAWCRLIADVTGVPASRSADAEPGARGAFLTGLAATGAAPDLVSAARSHVRTGATWEPDPERAEQYALRYAEFLGWRERIRADGWHGSPAVPSGRGTAAGSGARRG